MRPVASEKMAEAGTDSSISGTEELHITRVPLEQARHLPAHYYMSAELLEEEKEKLFFKDWLIVGRVEEFPKPGDYRAIDLLGEPVVICRNNEGELKAFSNTCRHRGVALVSGEGNARVFPCPYHAWTYDLNGKLMAASRSKGLSH